MHSLIGGVISGAHCLSPSMLATGMVLYTYSFRRCHVQRTSKIFGIYFHIQIQRELHVFFPFCTCAGSGRRTTSRTSLPGIHLASPRPKASPRNLERTKIRMTPRTLSLRRFPRRRRPSLSLLRLLTLGLRASPARRRRSEPEHPSLFRGEVVSWYLHLVLKLYIIWKLSRHGN